VTERNLTAAPLHWGHRLREQLAGSEDDGYFGPESAIWVIHREAVLALGLGRALLLQLAHPWVAQAVADHSTFRDDPRGRLATTVMAAEFLVFGDRAQADAAAAHVRQVHTRIHGRLEHAVGRWAAGTLYSAEEPDALLWVLATLTDSALVLYEACFGTLQRETVERYLEEATRLGAMIGVRSADAPRTRSDLKAYMNAMVVDGTVAVGPIALRMAGALLHPSMPIKARTISWPYRAAARAAATLSMPAGLREQYGPILQPRGIPAYRLGGVTGRVLLRRLPPHLRLDPIAASVVQRSSCSENFTGQLS
jgi:uncharacterized protein (DUF2236 family)